MRVTETDTGADAKATRARLAAYGGPRRPALAAGGLPAAARSWRDFEANPEGNPPVSTHHWTNIGITTCT